MTLAVYAIENFEEIKKKGKIIIVDDTNNNKSQNIKKI
jgi:hypothetical protein